MKIKRAADDIRDFFKERFPDGMYGEMGVAAIGHILEHNPNEHKKDKKEKEWKEFLVNVSSKVILIPHLHASLRMTRLPL